MNRGRSLFSRKPRRTAPRWSFVHPQTATGAAQTWGFRLMDHFSSLSVHVTLLFLQRFTIRPSVVGERGKEDDSDPSNSRYSIKHPVSVDVIPYLTRFTSGVSYRENGGDFFFQGSGIWFSICEWVFSGLLVGRGRFFCVIFKLDDFGSDPFSKHEGRKGLIKKNTYVGWDMLITIKKNGNWNKRNIQL